MRSGKVRILWNTEVQEIHGEDEVKSVRVKNNLTGSETVLDLEGLFIAIGHTPAAGVFQDHLDLDDQGYIITSPHSSRTSVPGVFACGDVMDKVYRQAITAAGTGCIAALDGERFLAHADD